MAVVQVVTFMVKPDRYEGFLDNARKSKALLERHGGKNVRFLAGLVAGEATGSFAMTAESDDFASYGSMMDKFFADPDVQAFMATVSTSTNPTGPYQTSLYVDVPV
jgi:hypothetical protein